MKKSEFIRLYQYHKIKQPSKFKPIYEQSKGRRSIKNKAKHVGFILKDSTLTSRYDSLESVS